MITASANFITEVTKLSRNFRARFLLNGTALSCEIKSIRIHKGSGPDVVPGSVCVPYIEAELFNCSTALQGETLTLEISVRTAPDTYDPITIGTFFVTKAKGDTSTLNITAVGMLARAFQVQYVSGLTYPASIDDMLEEISDGTNVEVSLQGIDGDVDFPRAITGHTCLEALGIIAGALGGFVTEDNAGGVVIAAYGSGDTLSVNGDRSATAPEVNDDDFTVTGIKCIVEDDGEEEVAYQYGVVNVEYHNAYMTQELFDEVCENFVGYAFRPGTVPLTIGDPRLEAWDTLEVEDLQGNTFEVPCISVEHYFDGGITTSVDAEVTVEEEADTMIRGEVTIAIEDATRAADLAQASASAAQASADVAYTAANAAQASADNAQESADAAQTSADEALESASEAKASAKNANDYAARALGNLSTVQSVSETLTWIAQHGTMAPTTDTALDPTHVYFVEDPDGDYEISGQSYSVVSDPDVADISTYYQLSIDESLNNYVGTHLALTSEGLWLIPDRTDGNRVLISTGGSLNMSLSVDENGRLIYSNSSGIPILFDLDDEGNLSSIVEDDETAEVSLDENDHAILESGATPYSAAGTYILDGDGEVVARFLSDIAQVGADSAAHTEIDAYGQRTYASDGETLLAEFAPTGAQIGDADGSHIEIDSSGQRIYDTDGVTELASFSSSGAQIGKSNSGHTNVTEGGMQVWSGSDGSTELAHIGYTHDGVPEGGGSQHVNAPYYSFGSRASGSDIGAGSFSAGGGNTASGYMSHAEGKSTQAIGDCAHAEGISTKAVENYSHAEGYQTEAHGMASHASGEKTYADQDHQFVVGRYNKKKPASQTYEDSLFTVGCGESEATRANAFEVKQNPLGISADDQLPKIKVNDLAPFKLIKAHNLETSTMPPDSYTAQDVSHEITNLIPDGYEVLNITVSGTGYNCVNVYRLTWSVSNNKTYILYRLRNFNPSGTGNINVTPYVNIILINKGLL